jgi:hypothetical protein
MASLHSVFRDTYGRAWNDLRGKPAHPSSQPYGDQSQAPYAPYGSYRGGEGITWNQDAIPNWLRDHPLDSQGIPRGPWPVPPAGIAMGIQQQHEIGVFDFRQRLMQDAVARWISRRVTPAAARPG